MRFFELVAGEQMTFSEAPISGILPGSNNCRFLVKVVLTLKILSHGAVPYIKVFGNRALIKIGSHGVYFFFLFNRVFEKCLI